MVKTRSLSVNQSSTYRADSIGHKRFKLVQYGPYWTLQNTYTSEYCLAENPNSPEGYRMQLGHFPTGWKIEKHGNYYKIYLWTSVNRGTTVVMDNPGLGRNTRLRRPNGGSNQLWEFRMV
ncbi:hypothetical protein BDP27DRAFT_1402130 [Rhodocollybia butyracea]|uniref:Uncharacterized protein n=1 Tax=Rhodocollybia butyracea TaxID=206335 RepID=A0A9P5U7T5_9AGAR|nr:hypothetical protein BDP27DRAFT_1402130 [Rhodocollybia butyracea]